MPVKTDHSRVSLRDIARTVILGGMALYLAYLLATGTLSYYINTRFQWLTYVALILLTLLTGWSLLQNLRGRKAHSTGTAFMHVPFNWGSALVVSVPLLLAVIVPAQPLGASAVNGGVSLNPVGSTARTTVNIPPEKRNIMDWLREFNREPESAVFNGEPVTVIGFIYREPSFTDDQFMVARYTMSCCVADAFAVGMPVAFDGAADFETGTWVEITGYLQAQDFDGDFMPVIVPEAVTETDIPETPYLYS